MCIKNYQFFCGKNLRPERVNTFAHDTEGWMAIFLFHMTIICFYLGIKNYNEICCNNFEKSTKNSFKYFDYVNIFLVPNSFV